MARWSGDDLDARSRGRSPLNLRDSLGDLWQREVLVQGNAVFTHAQNGNRITVPLRADAGRG